MAPPLPNMARAAAGGTTPRLPSSIVRGRSRATTDSPNEVARAKGILNHMRPPRRYPFHDAEGLAAIADCQ